MYHALKGKARKNCKIRFCFAAIARLIPSRGGLGASVCQIQYTACGERRLVQSSAFLHLFPFLRAERSSTAGQRRAKPTGRLAVLLSMNPTLTAPQTLLLSYDSLVQEIISSELSDRQGNINLRLEIMMHIIPSFSEKPGGNFCWCYDQFEGISYGYRRVVWM